MELAWAVVLLVVRFGVFSNGVIGGHPSRPLTVHIGAMYNFDSTIGQAAKVAIEAAVDDVNASPNILKGSRLLIDQRDTNYSGFLGIVEG